MRRNNMQELTHMASLLAEWLTAQISNSGTDFDDSFYINKYCKVQLCIILINFKA
jgi:hypothetical protein